MRLSEEHGLNPTIPVCFLCGNEKNEIALLGASYKGEAPMRMCLDKTPCAKCKEMMAQGVLLIEVQDGTDHENPYRMGNLVVLKDEAAQRIFDMDTTKQRAAFVEQKAWRQLGLPETAKAE